MGVIFENGRPYTEKDHTNLVRWVIQKYFPANIHDEDFFQEGCVGLCKALQNYEESRGFAFSTFAVPHIKGHCLKELRRRYRRAKLPTVSIDKAIAESNLTLQDMIADPSDMVESIVGEVSAEQILDTVKNMGLTTRQLNVMDCRIAGQTYDQICKSLGIGTSTVCKSMRAIKQAFSAAAAL